jgi:hypothetical protein
MANTSVIRIGGKTVALSVTASAHAAVQLTGFTPDQINYVACINTGAVNVAIKFSQISTDAATLPVDGTPGDFLLPALMEFPIVIACPPVNSQLPCYVTAIGAAAGPSLVYVTPAVDQS